MRLQNFDFIQSDEEEDNVEFSVISPNLLDVEQLIIDNLSLPNEQFYEICFQLNEGQQHLFNFILQYALHCKLAEKNNELPPKPFQIFLSDDAGVGKSFLIKAITEYLKQILRYPNQNLDQPSVLVTASTGNAVTGINGITLHSSFHLPVKSGLKSNEYEKPSGETVHMLRNRYQYLKVLIIDETSMIGREVFGHLDLALKAIVTIW